MSERMRQLRRAAGLSQQEVADRIGMTRVGYGKIENGKNGQRMSVLPKIAKALGCRIDDLFPEMDDAPTPEAGKTDSADGFDDDSLDALAL